MSAAPYEMTWSNVSYGTDGPWQAVSISMGSAGQSISLYPGDSWQSTILLSYMCDNDASSPTCNAKENAGGLYSPDQSSTWDNKSINLPPDGTWRVYTIGDATEVPIYALARRAMDTIRLDGIAIPNVDLVSISQGYQIYPNGNKYPLEVGVLSLGASDANQTFGEIGATFITSWLNSSGKIPSYSYGMHIGSAALNIPGSLFLGGYEKSRVLGNVSAQSYNSGSFPIAMLDIGIGVASGVSPWSTPSINGLLASGNSSLQDSATVLVTGANPYMYLPPSSCDAIAAELPVTYDSGLGLYLWNTSDVQYSEIATSPSYLAFTFSENEDSNANITINVPFALLNLTLETPLVDKPIPYFPCMGTNGTYVLGRAFLQAAFVGVNWATGTGNWFLAQAPGPGYSRTPSTTSIGQTDNTIMGSASSWEDTWSEYWSFLADTKESSIDSSSNGTRTPSPLVTGAAGSGGISTGVRAGIGVVCALITIAIVALGSWWFIRRRRRYQEDDLATSQESNNRPSEFQQHQQSAVEMETSGEKRELEGRQLAYELDQGPIHETYELSAN